MTVVAVAPATPAVAGDVAPRRRLAPIAPIALVAIGIGALGAVARFWLLESGGGLSGLGLYDDGVYFSAAQALVHGRLPYQDFLLLHPPGLLLALSPFAAMGGLIGDAHAFAAARLAFILLGGVNAGLVVVVLRRYGLPAATAGGLFYALFVRAAQAEQTIALETLGATFLLLSLILLERSRITPPGRRWWVAALIGGGMLGLAAGQKVWFVVPVIVVLAFSGRRFPVVALGAVATGLLVYLPFFVVAPGAMWREIVSDQLGRPNSSAGRPLFQLSTILGAPMRQEGLDTVWGERVAVVLAVVVLVALALAATTRGGRLFVVLFVASFATLWSSPSLFWHYASLTALPEALVVGVAVGVVASRIRPRSVQWVLVAGAGVALVALFAADVRASPTGLGDGHRVALAPLRAAASRAPGCIVADDPTALILMNRTTSELDDGCPLWPDVTGWTYDVDRLRIAGHDVPRVRNPLWQARARAYLSSGSAVVLARPGGTKLDAANLAVLTSGDVLFHRDGVELALPRH